jgi:hypothetical protein
MERFSWNRHLQHGTIEFQGSQWLEPGVEASRLYFLGNDSQNPIPQISDILVPRTH